MKCFLTIHKTIRETFVMQFNSKYQHRTTELIAPSSSLSGKHTHNRE